MWLVIGVAAAWLRTSFETVRVEDVRFFEDVYGHDRVLGKALGRVEAERS